MIPRTADFAEKRRILQLETLYDLALTLHADRSEEELLEELLQLVCAVLDPTVAVAFTRDPFGGPRSSATVGWSDAPAGPALLADPLWTDLLVEGKAVSRRHGVFCSRPFQQLLAVPLAYRGFFFGYMALLDKESRHEPRAETAASDPSDGVEPDDGGFSRQDRRFLDSVAALAGVALDSARQLETLMAQRERLEEENKALKGRLVEELTDHRIIAHAPPMRRVLDVVERIAPRNVGILLRGESGTGKEMIAKLIHSLSGREGALVAINCAAMPESLLESELFGIEGGVATGVQARRGKFALADGGTLFLDEIGDMDLALQVKLLRALQEREVTPVGGHQPIPVDVRIVAATHRDVEERVQDGRFREDLYYRLKGVDIELPALRERRQDIPLLVRHFVAEFCGREQIDPPSLDPEASALLLSHDFPGNVRELQNLVEGAVSLADGRIDAALVRSLIGNTDEAEGEGALDLVSAERRHIERVLKLTGGNKSAASRLLGVDRRTLQRKGF